MMLERVGMKCIVKILAFEFLTQLNFAFIISRTYVAL